MGRMTPILAGQQYDWRMINDLQQHALVERGIDVRKYGAVGDGVVNDAAAIQAAIDASSGPTAIYLPPLTFNLGTTSLSIAKEGVMIVGSGFNYNSRTGTILKYTGTSAAIKIGPGTATAWPEHFVLRDFAIDGTNSSTGGAYGIQIGASTGGSSGTQAGPLAPSGALAGAGAGNVDNGAHYYLVTFVTAAGEGARGIASAAVTVVDKTVNGQVNLTNIPTGSYAVTSRKVYRTSAGSTTNYRLLTTLNNNTTPSYVDNISDAAIAAEATPPAATYVPTNPTANGLIENVLAMRCSVAGMRNLYSVNVSLIHVTCRGNKVGFLFDNSTNQDNASSVHFLGCRFNDNDRHGLEIMGQVKDVAFRDCIVVGSGYEGVWAHGLTSAWRDLIFDNFRIEDSNQTQGNNHFYAFLLDAGPTYDIQPMIMRQVVINDQSLNHAMSLTSANTVESFFLGEHVSMSPVGSASYPTFAGDWRINLKQSGQWGSSWFADTTRASGYSMVANGTGLLLDLIGDSDTIQFGTAAGWKDWTPTVTQSGSVAVTVNEGKYLKLGTLAIVSVKLTVTGSGTTNNKITVGNVPSAIAPAITGGATTIGTVTIWDSGNTLYEGAVIALNATTFEFQAHNSADRIGVVPNFALAVNDTISFYAVFRTSS